MIDGIGEVVERQSGELRTGFLYKGIGLMLQFEWQWQWSMINVTTITALSMEAIDA